VSTTGSSHARYLAEQAMVNPFVTQESLNASTCTTILDEVPYLEQQSISQFETVP